ncbi:hypothetical protein DFP93_12352 [Aneurinibacillus soli]|uniref:Uncharacterized protein n=1 Tax=Aneurinibacillus soli TaxID=1500254 RepID=A0A0U5B0I2_9BACL|nr:hypothetical protein [Aneurinibacillus soli]PYE58506.1 hypothetical protein DFP93_12352 [Aneurinibacillus soli]BAU29482.1 hypothetical protein CB4_03682 [Aneurinibacillus soli]
MNCKKYIDLFSIAETREVIQGKSSIYYSGGVSSRSARLVQGSVEDRAVLYADTVGRAAALTGASCITHPGIRPELPRILEAYGVSVREGEEGEGEVTLEPSQWQDGNTVSSIQRFRLPPNRDAAWVGDVYMNWLPKELAPFVQVQAKEAGVFHFRAMYIPLSLLILQYDAEESMLGCHVYRITGGLLANQKETNARMGRLEFREIVGTGEIITALHNFVPRLPWPLYRLTQALIHLWVMDRFGRYLNTHT